jgi:hypothetical protein
VTRKNGRRAIAALALLAVLAAWLYIAVRARNLSFTHDEALSYELINGDPSQLGTANNHWLNSAAMRLSQALFGESELALRLPNVAAFGLYGAAVVSMLSRLRRVEAQVLGFALLLGNPFVLEFFGLARGYGLSLAFAAAAMACLFVGANRPPASGLRRPLAVGAFSSLALYANFSMLNVVVAILCVAVIDVIRGARAGSSRRTELWVLALGALALVPGIVLLARLRARGELYYGGDSGFVSDTIGSLLAGSTCGSGCTPSWIAEAEAAVLVTAAVASGWLLWRLMRGSGWTDGARAGTVFALAVLAVLAQSALMHTLYPIGRTALGYLLAFAALLAFVLDDVVVALPRRIVRAVCGAAVGVLAIGVAVNVERHVNVSYSTVWAYDASSRPAMQQVEALVRRRGAPIRPLKVIAQPPLHEALNYYRLRDRLIWLTPVLPEPISTPGGDLYYVGPGEAKELPPRTRPLAFFPATGVQVRLAGRALLARPAKRPTRRQVSRSRR